MEDVKEHAGAWAAMPPHLRGRIDDAGAVASLHPLFPAAFAFLRRKDLAALPCGSYEIAEGCRASVFGTDLKPFGEINRYEFHRKFIDIQTPIDGEETMGVVRTPEGVDAGFDAEKDCGFFDAEGEAWTLEPGEFAVFSPGAGAHAPALARCAGRRIRKVVVKVRFFNELKSHPSA